MYKIMIADDELIERKAFRLMIQKHFNDLELVPDAATGNDVIRIVKQYKPDILFLDIQMPQKNGLDALQELTEEINNSMKVIILSAYDKFEYAQMAMKYGASDFLLKPVHRHDMINVINSYIKKIDEERYSNAENENFSKRINMISPHIENEIIYHVINNSKTFMELHLYLKALNLEAEDYVIIIVKNCKKILWPVETVAEVSKEITHCIVSKNLEFGSVILLPINQQTEKFDSISWVMNYAQYIMQKLKEKGISSSIGISKFYSETKSIFECYRQAFVIGNKITGEILQYNENDIGSNTNYHSFEYNTLIELVFCGDEEKLSNSFSEFLRNLMILNAISQSQVKQKVIEMFIKIDEKLQQDMLKFENKVMLKKIESTENILLITDFIEKYLIQLNQKLIQNNQELNVALIKALEYIKQNYMKEITLIDVAEQVQISSFYLSKLFKLNLKKNFTDYITEMRIKKAKELLVSTNKSIKEITYEIGYNNPTYFCQVFKKTIGKSASQFRKEYYFYK